MRKLFLILLIAVFCVRAEAATIALHTDMSVDATIAAFNDNFKTISNWANGDIEGSGIQSATVNIKADSLGEIDFADEANPRVRDNELLGLTIANSGFVYTGLTPATSASLTSDISAGTAYINGYRIVKAATSNTYTASKDTYVDLSLTGVYTFSEVANGATAPSVAANSIRLAKSVTNGTAITSVTDLANRRIPGLIIPANYRDSMFVSAESTTTLSVFPGVVEVNNSVISKSTKTTLTVSGVSGDWAAGSDGSDPLEINYVGIDASGNIKLLTTRPTHQNYGVSVTDGKLRYVTENSTVYRVLGWFYLNGSEQLSVSFSTDTSSVSNFRDIGLANKVMKVGTTDLTSPSVAGTTVLMTDMDVSIDSSGGFVQAIFDAPILDNNGVGDLVLRFDGNTIAETRVADGGGNATAAYTLTGGAVLTPGKHTVRVFWRDNGSDIKQRGSTDGNRKLIVWEE